MKCKCCQKLVFNFRDGTLDPRKIVEIPAHLNACPSCREYYALEENFGRSLRTAAAAGVPTLSLDSGIAVSSPSKPIAGELRRRNYRSIWRNVFPFSIAAAGILTAIFLGPNILHRSKPPVPAFDELADPLGDWLEAKMIVTIENPATGESETFVSTRSDGVRPLPSGSAIR